MYICKEEFAGRTINFAVRSALLQVLHNNVYCCVWQNAFALLETLTAVNKQNVQGCKGDMIIIKKRVMFGGNIGQPINVEQQLLARH